jgi:hypothetical protein
MKNRVALLAVAALVVAACGGEAAVETTAAPDVTETTAAPATTVAPEITTTTSAPEATTTTAAPALEASVSPQLRRIQAAMSQTTEVPSARMIGDVRIVGMEGLEGDIAFSFEGAFDNRTGDSSFSLDLSSIGDALQSQMEAESAGGEEDEFGAAFAELFLGMFSKFEVRQVGDTVYMNNAFLASLAGEGTEWIASPAEPNDDPAGDFLQGAPTDPSELLDPFMNGNGDVVEIGPEIVRGVETTHYQITYDKQALLDSAPASSRAEVEEELGQFGDEVVIDLWMDDQYLYKFFFEVDGSQVEAPEGEGFERMTMTYEIFDYGADIVIEAPPADRVTFVEEEALSPGLGFGFGD